MSTTARRLSSPLLKVRSWGGTQPGSAHPHPRSAARASNAPARGVLLASLGPVASGSTYTVDVTKGVTAVNGEVDFRVSTTSGDGAHYYSKEGAAGNSSLTPQLTVTCS